MIVADLANPFFPDVVKAIQDRAHQRSLTTLLADSGEDPAAELELAHQLAPQVDGLVLCGTGLSDAELRAVRQLCPVVLINRESAGIASVLVDNADGARQAVRHLRALGHRRIGYVGGPRGQPLAPAAAGRGAGRGRDVPRWSWSSWASSRLVRGRDGRGRLGAAGRGARPCSRTTT